MSLTKKSRKVQSNSGNGFPIKDGQLSFAQAIADALQRDFGAHAAVKTVAARTGSNERAVKNWFMAKNGPAGQNLVDLMRISDAVLEAVLVMSGREELVINNRLLCSRHILVHMLDLVGDLQRVSARPYINGVREKQSAAHQGSATNRAD